MRFRRSKAPKPGDATASDQQEGTGHRQPADPSAPGVAGAAMGTQGAAPQGEVATTAATAVTTAPAPAYAAAMRLGALNEADSATLVTAVITLLGERGVQASLRGDGVLVTPDGFEMALDNLAIALPRHPRSAWDDLVTAHVDTLVGARAKSQEALPQEQFMARVYPRIYRADASVPFHPAYALDLGCDLFVVAAVDYPDRVDVLGGDGDLEPYGQWDAVMPRALDNLRALPVPSDLMDTSPRQPTHPRLHLWRSDDFYGAARYLLLDEMLARAGEQPSELGVLFALPSRLDLFVAVPTPDAVASAALAGAADELSRAAASAYGAQPGNISPHVYWRAADGSLTQLTRIDDAGHVTLELPPALTH